jgi:hypothetical protein
MTHWIVRHRESGEEQLIQHDDGYPPYNAVDFEAAQLPRAMDSAIERWDWPEAAIACRFSPAEAAAIMWEQAKAYCEQRQTAPVPVIGIVENDVIIAERNERGQQWIDRFTGLAGPSLSLQRPFAISFTDGANRYFTIDAEQILALSAASLTQQTICHGKSQLVRAAIAAALAADATAEQIFAIDITAGYPDPNDPVSPPPPPPQDES